MNAQAITPSSLPLFGCISKAAVRRNISGLKKIPNIVRPEEFKSLKMQPKPFRFISFLWAPSF